MMTTTLNLSLSDELRAFVDQNSGDGTLYATPSEFLRDVLREKKQRMEAANLRDSILTGYQDLLKGNSVTYQGSIREVMKQIQQQNGN